MPEPYTKGIAPIGGPLTTADEPSDEALLDQYFVGNARAFEHFFRRHSGRVIAYALSKGLPIDAAKDASQEAFLRLHRSIHRYERGRPALPWFFTIVHHCIVDTMRKGRPAAAFAEGAIDALPLASPDTEVAGSLDVGTLLVRLPDDQRQLVRLRVFDELSFREISLATGRTEVSLRKAFERARRTLKKALGRED